MPRAPLQLSHPSHYIQDGVDPSRPPCIVSIAAHASMLRRLTLSSLAKLDSQLGMAATLDASTTVLRIERGCIFDKMNRVPRDIENEDNDERVDCGGDDHQDPI